MWRLTSGRGVEHAGRDHRRARGRRARSRSPGRSTSVSALIQTTPMWTSCAPHRRRSTDTVPRLARQADRDVERVGVADGVDARRPRPGRSVGLRRRRAGPPRQVHGRRAERARRPRGARRPGRSRSPRRRPTAFATWTAHRPTGPSPSTATVSPGSDAGLRRRRGSRCPSRRRRTAPRRRTCPRGRAAASRLACGTSTCSACAPWSEPRVAPWPNTRASSHFWKAPRMQKKHAPHAVWKQPSTRSPTATRVTASRPRSTVPTNSWPIMKPGSILTRPW